MPEDVARRFGFLAGEEALLRDGENGVSLEPLDERRRDQLNLMKRLLKEDDAVLAALAK